MVEDFKSSLPLPTIKGSNPILSFLEAARGGSGESECILAVFVELPVNLDVVDSFVIMMVLGSLGLVVLLA